MTNLCASDNVLIRLLLKCENGTGHKRTKADILLCCFYNNWLCKRMTRWCKRVQICGGRVITDTLLDNDQISQIWKGWFKNAAAWHEISCFHAHSRSHMTNFNFAQSAGHLSIGLLHHCQPNQTKCSSEFNLEMPDLLVLKHSRKKKKKNKNRQSLYGLIYLKAIIW